MKIKKTNVITSRTENIFGKMQCPAAANPLLASGQDPHKSKVPPRLRAQRATSSSQYGAGEK